MNQSDNKKNNYHINNDKKKNKDKLMSSLLIIIFTSIIILAIILIFRIDKRSALEKQNPYCFDDEIFYNGVCTKCPERAGKEGGGFPTDIPGCKCALIKPVFLANKTCSTESINNIYTLILQKNYVSNNLLNPTLVFPYADKLNNPPIKESNEANITGINIVTTGIASITLYYINDYNYLTFSILFNDENPTTEAFEYDLYLDPDNLLSTKFKRFSSLQINTASNNINKGINCHFYNMYGTLYNFITFIPLPCELYIYVE